MEQTRPAEASVPTATLTAASGLPPLSMASAALAGLALAGLLVGLALWGAGAGGAADWSFTAATGIVLLALIAQIAIDLPRGRFGLDVLAAISMATAIVLGAPLAGNVVALMYAGGQLLEDYAEGHARRAMTALLGRVSATAMRYRGEALEEVPTDVLRPGDRVLIRHGEVVPADGIVASGRASLDESALTGEALPVGREPGEVVLSGSSLVGAPFDLLVTRPAAESTYAGIVRLVEQAQAARAPMARLADRYAIGFLVLSLLIAGGALLVSGEPIRFLAVLVVATPCPLILAVPVAMISGMSRAARSGILFKTGGALENMARIRTVILDKTGTLTFGDARVHAIHPVAGVDEDEVLRFAASLDQASSHPIARALVAEARARGLPLSLPSALNEQAGSGIEGEVEGRRVALGGTDYVAARAETAGSGALGTSGAVTVSMALDGQWAGEIVLADEVRPDAARVVSALRELGVGRVILASGDRPQVAEAVGSALGVDRVLGGLTPADKADLVAAEGKAGHVMMIGDGTNDAPALARADVGVAMGSRGGAAAAEAAAAVVLVDRLEPVIAGMRIARRARRIALESVYFGLGLSILGMLAAAAGFVPPVGGALLQEAIDIAVILNALRVLI